MAILDTRRILGCQGFGLLSGPDAKGPPRFEINEGGRHDPIILEFHGPLAQFATGHGGNGVGGTAVDLDVDNYLLAMSGSAFRVIDADEPASFHRHPNAKDLPRADMTTMGLSGFFQQVFKGFHIGTLLRYILNDVRMNECLLELRFLADDILCKPRYPL